MCFEVVGEELTNELVDGLESEEQDDEQRDALCDRESVELVQDRCDLTNGSGTGN